MNKTPYFIRNADGSFEFFGYFATPPQVDTDIELVDASFLYRTVTKANEALNNMPLPEGCN